MENEGKNDLKRASAIISILFSITLLGIVTFSQNSNNGITGAAIFSGNNFSSQPLLTIVVGLTFLILGAIVLFKLNR
jgi:succinate dehydrogenase hydrophobic anchor subunit